MRVDGLQIGVLGRLYPKRQKAKLPTRWKNGAKVEFFEAIQTEFDGTKTRRGMIFS
jgi:hypothetical protein